MAQPPNQFQPVYVVFNRHNGLTYETALAGQMQFDSEEAARVAAEETMVWSRACLDGGRIEGADGFWCLRPSAYTIRGFYDSNKDPTVRPVQFRGIDIRPTRSISDMDRDDPTAL